jgi:chromosome segregation ATPase
MTIAILAALFASIALADDFKTNDGKEYKNATVRRVEADGIVVSTKGGISKLYFTELPSDIQKQFHYEPEKATAAHAAEVTAIQQANQQTEKLAKQQQRETSERQSRNSNAQQLRNSLVALQEEEDSLLVQIGQIETASKAANKTWVSQGGATWGGSWSVGQWGTNPSEVQLPALRARLDNVREEKQREKQELDRLAAEERTQRQP